MKVTTGFMVYWPMGRLTMVRGRPKINPTISPGAGWENMPNRGPSPGSQGAVWRDFIAAKNMAQTTTPMPKKRKMAPNCSPVLAAAATLSPARRRPSIIRSMPIVTSGPGISRAIQSNRAKGTKGKSSSLSTRYINPIRGAVSSPPARAPKPRPGSSFFISTPPAETTPVYE